MTVKKLLDKCEDAYFDNDFKRLIRLCDEVLKKDPNNQTAISYKSISYCFLNQPKKAIEMLKEAEKLYPENYYHKNILAMSYYDIGEYERSLECCDEGLKIKDFDWLYKNRIKALLKLDRVAEAIEFYENSPVDIEIHELLIEAGQYGEALKYCLEVDDFELLIDDIKQANPQKTGVYYMSWIDRITFRFDTETCPDCGGRLIPIVWGLPGRDLLESAERGEVFLGGCCVEINSPNYHCRSCGHEFDLGYEGLNIEYGDSKLNFYIEYKIDELLSNLKSDSLVFIRSLDSLKRELGGYDDKEFNAFISHLIKIGYIYEPNEGYVKLTGFEDWRCAKEYPDENKFAAPKWLAYPNLSPWTIGWRMGGGENYAMNEPAPTEEFKKLFPMPKYWQFSFSKSPCKPHPVLGYFWNNSGKPKYPQPTEGIPVSDFIAFDELSQFQSDTFTFKSIEHAVLLSKFLYFERCERNEDLEVLKSLKLTPDEENAWDVYGYSVLLNACYFRVMQDESLKLKLLSTGGEPLISDDDENLFGRALMELRDEIRRICRNEERIDWEYTEFLKYIP